MKMTIYVCDDADKVDAAVLVLKAHGYADDDIKTEEVEALNYDGLTYSKGVKDHFMTHQWVVTGRK